jgi:hypothetical protein
MLFMVIEHFKDRDAIAVYTRAKAEGRIMPEGLRYIESWVETTFDRCFQLVECSDASLLQRWILAWRDIIDFEIVPVVTSAQTVENVRPALDGAG